MRVIFKPKINPIVKIKSYIEKEKPRVLGRHEHLKKLEVMGRTSIKWHLTTLF